MSKAPLRNFISIALNMMMKFCRDGEGMLTVFRKICRIINVVYGEVNYFIRTALIKGVVDK